MAPAPGLPPAQRGCGGGSLLRPGASALATGNPAGAVVRGRGREDQLARWGEVGMEEGEVLRQL